VNFKRKVDRSPFGVLFSSYLDRVEEIAQEMGVPIASKELSFVSRAKFQLQRAIDSPEVTAVLGLSMTSLVMSIPYDEVNKSDPTIARYAVNFAVEHRLEIAEAILTEDKVGGPRVY
jgi:hypothetical protein